KKAFYCFRATLTGPSLMDIDAVQTFFKQFQPAKIHYDMAESKEPSNSAINENCMDAYMEAIKGEVEGVKQKELGEAHLRLFQGFLKSLERKEKILRKCISPGVTYIAVSPEGDVYPCHRFVGNKDTSLGNLHRGFDRNKWLEQYAKVNIYHSPVCSKCWARYMCGGMCTFNNYYLDGSLVLTSNSDREPVHCLQQKKIIEEAIRYYCYLSENYAETEIKEAITQEAVSEKSVSEESPTGEKEA
ncbi:MAG: SPASM domain-containing protein, partial [bacterium]|nr:SPASM domain-containing protein [bacterium]